MIRTLCAFVTSLWRAIGMFPGLGESPDRLPRETGRVHPGEYRVEWPSIRDP